MRINWAYANHQPVNTMGEKDPNFMKAFSPRLGHYDNPDDPSLDKDTSDAQRVLTYQFDTIVQAVRYLDLKVQQHEPCNQCFRRLPGRRSFKEVYNDPDVWVNFMENANGAPWGFTNPASKDVGLHSRSLARGYLFVAATLVHELAHVNGASGEQISQDAEATLKFCLLSPQFNPDTFGTIQEFINPAGAGSAYA